MTVTEAAEIVKAALRVQARHIAWPSPGIMAKLRAREAAWKAVANLPRLTAESYPYYPSCAVDQSGCIVAAHLAEGELAAMPLHIANEVLDDLGNLAAGVPHTMSRQKQREVVLERYGPALADLVCAAIDEALGGRRESYKRLSDWEGTTFAPLSSDEIDEPRYDTCGPDDEHASPATSFDFQNAIEAARELIEERDRAAAAIRRGEVVAA